MHNLTMQALLFAGRRSSRVMRSETVLVYTKVSVVCNT